MNATDVIGYAYDAAIHCPQCARHAFSSDMPNGIDPSDALDSEGNPISAVFADSETDCPTHCDDCGEFIPEDLTPDGFDYVADALGSYLRASIFGGHGGNASILDTWREHYGSWLDSKLVALYDKCRKREESARTVIFGWHEQGCGRSYAVGIDGEAYTTFTYESDGDNFPDECSECGASVYAGWVCLDGGAVCCSSHVVTPRDARDIAHSWHSGSGSALYEFASSGIPNESAVVEVRHALRELDNSSRPTTLTSEERHEARNELRALLAYLDAKSGNVGARFVSELARTVVPYGSANVERIGAHVLEVLRQYGIGDLD